LLSDNKDKDKDLGLEDKDLGLEDKDLRLKDKDLGLKDKDLGLEDKTSMPATKQHHCWIVYNNKECA